MRQAMQRDERVFLMGEDVGRYGGSFGVSLGLLEEFGPERVRDAPLSESAFVGAGIGAALGGMRPIVEIMTVNFSMLALDQLVNTAAALHHMSGGQFSVPLVVRMTSGAGRQLAAQHSHSLENWYAHVPGLRVLAPATIADARGMLWPALEDPDPVIIVRARVALQRSGEPVGDEAVAESTSRTRPSDEPATTSPSSPTAGRCRRCSTPRIALAADGVSAEVVDLRVLRPLDWPTVLDSVRTTHRAVVVDEGWHTLSPGRRGERADRRGGLLRPRRPGAPGLHGRGADPVRAAARARRAAQRRTRSWRPPRAPWG